MGSSQTTQFTKQILSSGVMPFTMLYSPVIASSGSSHKAYRTSLQINAAGIGTLLPKDYIGVANRSVQCLKLFEKSVKLAARDVDLLAPRNGSTEWVSVYAPEKLIKKKDSAKLVSDIIKETGMIRPERICLEFPAEVLYDDTDEVTSFLLKIKDIGCKTCVNGVCGEFSPVTRLALLPFDFVIFDREFTKQLNFKKTMSAALSLVSYVKSLDKRVILTDIEEAHMQAVQQATVFGFLPVNPLYTAAAAALTPAKE